MCLILCHCGTEIIQGSIPFPKCLFSRAKFIQGQVQPRRDGAAVSAVQLQHSALNDARNWAGKDGFSWRPTRCSPRPQKQVGAILACCDWHPAQLLLSWCEWKFVQVRLSIRGVTAVTKCLVILISPLQSESTPPECLVRCLSLLTGVLAAYVSTGFLTEKEACYSQLFTKAKVSDASQCIKMWMYLGN